MSSQRGDEKFSWGELTEAKNPKNKKNTKKISFIKGTPSGRSGKRGVVSRSDEFADRIQHMYIGYLNYNLGLIIYFHRLEF